MTIARHTLLFTIMLLAELWVAHAVVMFSHEYAHAFTAWALGWKSSPFDLHFPPLNAASALIQLGINQNVDETPIYAAHRPTDAGLIALAGALIGNACISLPLGLLLFRQTASRNQTGWALLAFWICIASIGNFYDYVPIRTFTTESDMGSVQRGLSWSPWTIMATLGIPTLIAMIWALGTFIPTALTRLFPDAPRLRYALATLAMFVLFGFYGGAGFLEGGPTCRHLSQISFFVLLPLATSLEIHLLRQRARQTT